MRLTIDFETRSACDIKRHGAWVYSEHPTTEVLCLALKWHGKQAVVWGDVSKPECRIAIGDIVRMAETIEAHNMSFEYAIWQNIMVKRYGWPSLPVEKLRCSAAKVSMHALPRSLGESCHALSMNIQKDMVGYKLMMRLCKPRLPRKGEDLSGIYWHDSPEERKRLQEYCIKDVEAEEALSAKLQDLPPKELAVWQLDHIINARGIQADIPAAKAMLAMVNEHEAKLLGELSILTHGAVTSAKQAEKLCAYLRGLGVYINDVTASSVADALRMEIPDDARKILEIRRSLGRSSSAKYQAIIDRASADGRVRGTLLYHGAGTGRWSGAGIQPQNFPSRIKTDTDPTILLDAVLAGGLGMLGAICDDDPMAVAGAITRSVLIAKPGHDLLAADYSAIEGRGLAWLAGEESELKNYRKGLDVYVANAASILNKPYDSVTKEERQSPGKISVLACGYSGGVGAVRKFGGQGMSDEEISERIVRPWRKSHPMTTKLWYGLEDACMSAVRNPGSIHSYRSISYKVQGGFLLCRLPSGRMLYYYNPMIMEMPTSWGTIKECVTYMTVDSMTKKWVRTNTYSGRLAENVTQAVCRDIMAEAMLRVEAAGYPLVLTVHDELVAEVPEGFGSVEEFCELMCIVPEWAKGFPINAAGWRGKRYRK